VFTVSAADDQKSNSKFVPIDTFSVKCSRMDMRQLNYFIAVAQDRHLSRAAERLHVSQPPLTRHIQALEAELGAKLFKRTAKGMTPTQAGEMLLKDALSIRGMIEQAAERVQRAGLGKMGYMGVGTYGSSIFGVVARILAMFTAAHPMVEITVNHAQTADQVAALRQGRVLVVFERWLPDEPDIKSSLLIREPLFLALSDRHPLAKRKIVAVEALQNQTLITGVAPNLIAGALDLCRKHGFEPRFAPPANDVVMAALLVTAGRGVSMVPESMLNVHFPGVVYRRLKSRFEASMEVHYYYLKDEASPLLDAMLQTVRAFQRGGRDHKCR
jgi:DNA-binding transcriptional LysR family regulator